MSKEKNIINQCWHHLLEFRSNGNISAEETSIYAYSVELGVTLVDQVDNQHSFYLSRSPLDVDDYQSETFFDAKLHLYYESTADVAVVKFLRDYWVLIAYIKMKPAREVFLISHMAQSLDGKVCTNNGHSKWIGNDENLIHAHRLRAIVDGVMVGGKTAKADLPKLTVRHVDGEHPVRIIFSDNFDNYQNLPTTDHQQTINIRSISSTEPSHLDHADIEYYSREDDHYLKGVLAKLSSKGIKSILVEGGPSMASSFLSKGLIDVVQLHVAPIILGSGKSIFHFAEIAEIQDAAKIQSAHYSSIGDAQMITGIPSLPVCLKNKSSLKRRSSAPIPTAHGTFDTIAYAHSANEQMPHLVLLNKATELSTIVNVRIHSECITGDLFGSYRCECGEQLDKSMEYVSCNGGLIIYLRQEGRGIGIINKLHAYSKQDEGYNTADANKILGFGYDDRTYQDAVDILNDLGVEKINLLTNNSDKINAISNANIIVASRIPLEVPPKKENIEYLRTKKEFFGHKLHKI